jgi:hypothetical protein
VNPQSTQQKNTTHRVNPAVLKEVAALVEDLSASFDVAKKLLPLARRWARSHFHLCIQDLVEPGTKKISARGNTSERLAIRAQKHSDRIVQQESRDRGALHNANTDLALWKGAQQ